GQKEHALFVEARRLAAKVAVKEDAALVSTVEEIEPAIAVEIGELSKHPAIAARGRMLNAISWRQENDRLKLAGPLAQVNRQAAEDIRLAIAIPIEELDAKRRQRGAAPRAGQWPVVDGELRSPAGADVVIDVDVFPGTDDEIKQAIAIEVH